jgi:hypothetical protein
LARTPFLHGTLLPGQHHVHTIDLQAGTATFASLWSTGTLALTLIDPAGQLINPAYAAANPDRVHYQADGTAATYVFPSAAAGRWQMRVQAASVPGAGSNYTAVVAFESESDLTARADRSWYNPGAIATISATLSTAPIAADLTAIIRRADGISESVAMTPLSAQEYVATYTIPPIPGYVDVQVIARGTTAAGLSFEQGRGLAFQIAPEMLVLSGAYYETPEPWLPGGSLYRALMVDVGVDVTASGRVGLSADLVDSTGEVVAHALARADVDPSTNTLTLRFDGTEIYGSKRDGPYMLTNVLVTNEDSSTLVMLEAQDVYTTRAYAYRDFRTGEMYLPVLFKQS